MAKPKLRKQITEAKLAMKDVMLRNLAPIADAMIAQIISKLNSLPESKRLQAITDIAMPGQRDYREALLSAFAVVAADALDAVRKEVPKAKNVKLMENEDSLKLGDFEALPPGVRSKLTNHRDLLVDTQLNDLQKAIYFQFNHSVDSTDSIDTIRDDLTQAADDYIAGAAIEAGAGVAAAQTINETRMLFFSDDEVLDQIDAFEFVNGDPVSPICQDLAGTVFAVDDPQRLRYTPPLHFNCKSYIAPILKGNLGNREVSSLQPSSKKLEDSIQFAEQVCCGGHFRVESETGL